MTLWHHPAISIVLENMKQSLEINTISKIKDEFINQCDNLIWGSLKNEIIQKQNINTVKSKVIVEVIVEVGSSSCN